MMYYILLMIQVSIVYFLIKIIKMYKEKLFEFI